MASPNYFDTLCLPMVQANEICRRAIAQYLADVGDDRRGWVYFSVPFRRLIHTDDGRVHVANLRDDLERISWYIAWDRETDVVGLIGPRR